MICFGFGKSSSRDWRIIRGDPDEQLINNERKGRFASQGLGVGASLVGHFHDALSLVAINVRKQRMQLDSKTVAMTIILNQADQSTHGGIANWRSKFLGSTD